MNKLNFCFLLLLGFLFQNLSGQSGFVSGASEYGTVGQIAYKAPSGNSMTDGLQQNIVSTSPLPINLLSFKVFCNNGKVDCVWETATETHNAYFTLERSPDGYYFEPVAQIKGAINSNTVMTYRYADMNPFSGTSYYRLSQTDLNGATEIFSPVFTECSFTRKGFDVSVYPNPAHDRVTITSSGFEITRLALRDVLGKEIKQADYTGLTAHEFILDISLFSKGIYFIDIYSQDDQVTKKIIKQ